MNYKDYYKILGVDKTASDKEIKQAYRKLARQYHPDVNPGDKAAEEKFKEINEANEVLGDPEKRKKYDELGPYFANGGNPFDFQGGGGNPFGGGGFSYDFSGGQGNIGGFSDFFSAFFGNAGGGRGRGGRVNMNDLFGGAQRGFQQEPETQEITLEISLEEAFEGTERTIQVPVRKTCPSCGGTGFTGATVCSTCRGSGKAARNSSIDVKIPAGVRTGSKIKVENYILVIKIIPHKYFEVNGVDLTEKLPISITEAVLGAEIDVPTLKGRVSVKIPPMTQAGKKLRIPGFGLPSLKGNGGDLYIEIKIASPEKISTEEKALFEKLAEIMKDNPRKDIYRG